MTPRRKPCEVCDDLGPIESPFLADWTELHRTLHDLWDAIRDACLTPIERALR